MVLLRRADAAATGVFLILSERIMHKYFWLGIGILLLCAGCTTLPQRPPAGMPAQAAAPSIAPGTHWRYVVHDGYTGLPRGTADFTVKKIDNGIMTVAVTHQGPRSGTETRLYTRTLNLVRGPMENDQVYSFNPPLLLLPFPLHPGQHWRATSIGTRSDFGAGTYGADRRTQTIVYGDVAGWQRVTGPAGTFDTLRIDRKIYLGDWDYMRSQTYINETDWYAPSIGRVVRHEESSGYRNYASSGPRSDDNWISNDWLVYELLPANGG
jgi:hypothetical protein